MKKILSSLLILSAAILLLSACNRNPAPQATMNLSYADTVGLAQFQTWKAQHERVDPAMAYQPVQQAVAAAPVRRTTSRSSASKSSGTVAQPTSTASQKKGWSKAANGTAIGAGSGAILGAVIHKKNRVLGGVIGGVVGGGIGYGIGRSMDKKDGRAG